ncbi:hypothetical protein FCH28_07515 [Streptomyces piniterrae]|uniref:Condensation domain-containing protein n=1 Tax=Streptomyces piniterrae TaxID=2571125 RepID=A0A4U0NTA4_9ACTN|nr:condensation domain-containing protein [Streptomyces piniterrae]TJZ57272.1 hypothetical protein FCH28_07515 [Streptomyces piniterrae]
MRMMEIADYMPRPGELVEFRAVGAAVAAAAAAPVHPAPPSHLQENHIRRILANQAAGRTHSPWVGVVFDVPGRLDSAAMARALAKWARRHPTLLTWFTLDDDRLIRHAVPADTFALEPVPCGTYDSGAALREQLLTRFTSGTHPLRWPSFVAGAVLREEDNASTVWFGVDHTHSDGYSATLVFPELRALYEAELSGGEAHLPAAGSYVDYCTLDRQRTALIGPDDPGVRRWADFYRAGPAPGFPLDLGTEPGVSYPGVPFEMDLFDATEAEAFAAACKRRGAGAMAGMLAALAITGHELGGVEDYRGLSVIHTRTERRWQRTQGWLVNLVPVEFPATDGFGKAAIGAQQAIVAAKDLVGVTPMRVMELAADLADTVQSDTAAAYPMVSYLDGRHVPGSRDWTAANCNGLEGPATSREVHLWINRLWDRTYLKTRYPDTPDARRNVPRFLTHLRRVLRTVARTGDWPPSG